MALSCNYLPTQIGTVSAFSRARKFLAWSFFNPGDHTMLRRLAIFSALAFSSVAIAHADSISGFFSATGTDSFTSTTITFTPGSSQIAGGLSGTFATYLTDGNPITFLSGALPYLQGFNTPPNPPYTMGFVPKRIHNIPTKKRLLKSKKRREQRKVLTRKLLGLNSVFY